MKKDTNIKYRHNRNKNKRNKFRNRNRNNNNKFTFNEQSVYAKYLGALRKNTKAKSYRINNDENIIEITTPFLNKNCNNITLIISRDNDNNDDNYIIDDDGYIMDLIRGTNTAYIKYENYEEEYQMQINQIISDAETYMNEFGFNIERLNEDYSNVYEPDAKKSYIYSNSNNLGKNIHKMVYIINQIELIRK